MLCRLIYASQATSPGREDLSAILDFSRAHNPGVGITGALCLLDQTYMEYLEGDEAAVDALYETIRHDRRHRNPTVLDRRPITQRAFPQWSLALMEWDDRTKAIFRSFSPGQNLDLYASDPSTAAPLVRALTKPEDWKFLA
jgi:hypothetical protein